MFFRPLSQVVRVMIEKNTVRIETTRRSTHKCIEVGYIRHLSVQIENGSIRPFSSSSYCSSPFRYPHHGFASSSGHYPVTLFSEEERLVRETTRNWADHELKPIVRAMDNEEKIRPDLIKQLFANGFMAMVRLLPLQCYV